MVDPVEARRLLDADEAGRLLGLVTPEEVGIAWSRYATRTVGAKQPPDWAADPDGWAAELTQESEFMANAKFVRRFLLEIANSVPDEALGWVGAGPLEEFIREYPEQRAWAEEQATRSERFARALANAWIENL